MWAMKEDIIKWKKGYGYVFFLLCRYFHAHMNHQRNHLLLKYEQLFKIFWRTAILNMLIRLWNNLLINWVSMFNIHWNNIWRKHENLFILDLFYNIVQIFCIKLQKADFIMTTVAQVSDVSFGYPVKLELMQNKLVLCFLLW